MSAENLREQVPPRRKLQTKPEFALCRDLMHPWQPHTAKKIRGGYERTLECSRCGSIKTQVLDRLGLVLKSRMTYAPDYLLPKGSGAMTKEQRAALRLANTKAF